MTWSLSTLETSLFIAFGIVLISIILVAVFITCACYSWKNWEAEETHKTIFLDENLNEYTPIADPDKTKPLLSDIESPDLEQEKLIGDTEKEVVL